jgi:hypothetical protein
MFHRLLVMFEVSYKFYVRFAGEVAAFAAMVDLLFRTADAKIAAGVAAALEKAILRPIPAASAQRVFAQNRLGSFRFADPPHTSVPRNQRFRRVQILLHCDFV